MLKMPEEYYGTFTSPGGYTKTVPRKWTENEMKWVMDRVADGYTISQIAESIDRTAVSVQVKVKRLQKKLDSYNDKHRGVKYNANAEYMDMVKPKSVLDVYAGNSFYKQYDLERLVTNDLDERFETDFHMDALKFLYGTYIDNQKFDVVDLDPYGSAYECFDVALKIAKKGIIVSFGEWGHKRWRRLDFVSKRYGIESEDEFTEEKLIGKIVTLAAINKKKATPVIQLKYNNFFRVYFTLERLLITEQWDKNDDTK